MDAPAWRDHEPPDEWAVQPLSDDVLAAALVAAVVLLVATLAVVVVWS